MANKVEEKAPQRPQTLRSMLEAYQPQLVDRLSANMLFLTYLAKFQLIENKDVLNLEKYRDPRQRNMCLLAVLTSKEEKPQDYIRFLEALRRSNQEHIAAMLTNVDKELSLVDEYQSKLENQLTTVQTYISKEGRRIELKFKGEPKEDMDVDYGDRTFLTTPRDDRDTLTDFLYKVHTTTKATLFQFERCKEVIDKLHKDCDEVARANAEMLVRLKDCDNMIKDLAKTVGVLGNSYNSNVPTETSGGQSPGVQTPRSKKDEVDSAYNSIKANLKDIREELNTQNSETSSCAFIIDNMIKDIDERKGVLAKVTDPPPKDGRERKYYVNLMEQERTIAQVKARTNLNPIRAKLEELARHLVTYVHQETQLTHRSAISHFSYQKGLKHRNFDAVDNDIKHLHRQIKIGDHQSSMNMVSHLAEITKSERQDCLLLIDEIEKGVRERKHKLSELADTKRIRRKPSRLSKRRKGVSIESNFSKRLTELNEQIQTYMHMEIQRGEKLKSDFAIKRKDVDQELKIRNQNIKDLERRLRDVEIERDKFKRLYGQEKAQILFKPTIPKRGFDGRTKGTPRLKDNNRSHKTLFPNVSETAKSSPALLPTNNATQSKQQVAVKPLPRIPDSHKKQENARGKSQLHVPQSHTNQRKKTTVTDIESKKLSGAEKQKHLPSVKSNNSVNSRAIGVH